MARFLVLWRMNPAAPWPTYPSEYLELNEKMFAAIDGLIEKGEIEDIGFFPDGTSGYGISKGEATDIFRRTTMFIPYYKFEVHEIIPYEKGKEIVIALIESQI